MRLTFLGTRGNIRMASATHRYNASLLVEAEETRVLVDAGGDWRGRLGESGALDAVLVTHAHEDHAAALRDGVAAPVYATATTHELLERYPIDRHVVAPAERVRIGALTVSAHEAAHSLRAPAVGYRMEHRRSGVFYVPDVLELVDPAGALRGVLLYVGDGATFGRAIVRRRGDEAFGHATIETQLGWCADQGVKAALFTHCGSRLVRRPPEETAALVASLGAERGVAAAVAHDGLTIDLDASATAARGRRLAVPGTAEGGMD